VKRPIKATRDRAATLARLVASGKVSASGLSREGGQSQPVAVRITNSIAAGDSGLKDATLMELVGGVLTDTRRPIKVRHVGESAVAAGTVVTPEWCGKLGLCFAYAAGQPVPEIAIPINRRFRAVGPVATELGTENLVWSFGSQQIPATSWAGFTGYYAAIDYYDTANRTTYSPSYAPWSTAYRWTYRLHPMRFEASSFTGTIQGGRSYDAYKSLGLSGGSLIGDGGALWYDWDAIPLMARGDDVGFSNYTLGANSHLSEMEISGVSLRPSSFLCMDFTERQFPNAPLSGYSQRFAYYTFAEVTHYRLWIDGSDITGVVSVPANTARLDSRFGQYTSVVKKCKEQIVKALTPSVKNLKTVWVDFWIKVVIESTNSGPSTDPPAPACEPQVLWVHPRKSTPSSLLSAIPSKNTTGKTWSLVFDADGPGGVSSIETKEQANWTFLSQNNAITLTQTASPNDSIVFDWNREIPEIRITKPATLAFPALSTWIYKPVPSGDYDSQSHYGASVNYQYGCWNPNAATTFNLAQSLVRVYAAGAGYADVRYNRFEDQYGEQYFTDCPQQITVTPV